MNVANIKVANLFSYLSSTSSGNKGPQEDERRRMGKELNFFYAMKMFDVNSVSFGVNGELLERVVFTTMMYEVDT